MIEHLTEILGFTFVAVFGFMVGWFIGVLRKWFDIENAERIANALDSIVEDAVLAIEEEARTTAPGNTPTSAMKRELAVGFVTRMLQERKATVPLDIIISKIDASFHRLFHHDKCTGPS